MQYKSENSGLLKVEMVKGGERLILLEPAYSTFSQTKQKTYWDVKVYMHDGKVKLVGLMETVCDAFANEWGSKTEDWVGHTVEVEIRTSKAGNPYMTFKPTDAEIVDVIMLREDDEVVADVDVQAPSKSTKVEEKYPAGPNPDDIPF